MKAWTALIACLLPLGACAIPPSGADLADVPVVRFGQPAPAGKDFILFYPAGTPLPVLATVDGSLLAKTGQSALEVATVRDVYVFRQWVSFDGKTWVAGNNAVGGRFEITLPGERTGAEPGTLSARFDLRS